MLYPNAKNFLSEFENKTGKIIKVYEATISNKLPELEGILILYIDFWILNAIDMYVLAWDKNTKALLSIVHMLPSTAKGKKNRNYSRDTLISLIEKVLIFASVSNHIIKFILKLLRFKGIIRIISRGVARKSSI